MQSSEVDSNKELVLTEKELKLIQIMRQLVFFKIEVHGEGGQPVRIVHIKESIKLYAKYRYLSTRRRILNRAIGDSSPFLFT